MENLTDEQIKYCVFEHYSEIAERCLKVIESHPEEIPTEKIKQYINNDVIRRILVARDYDVDKAIEMWKKWLVITSLT
jgi:hypothetical protein